MPDQAADNTNTPETREQLASRLLNSMMKPDKATDAPVAGQWHRRDHTTAGGHMFPLEITGLKPEETAFLKEMLERPYREAANHGGGFAGGVIQWEEGDTTLRISPRAYSDLMTSLQITVAKASPGGKPARTL